MIRQTHTYAVLEVSAAAYDEIAGRLLEAGYHHAFMEDGGIDMHGIGVTKADPKSPHAERPDIAPPNSEDLFRQMVAPNEEVAGVEGLEPSASAFGGPRSST